MKKKTEKKSASTDKVIDGRPIYKGDRLNSKSPFELNLQLAILHHKNEGMLEALQGVIKNCTDDTLKLIADAINGDLPKKNGRPKGDVWESEKKALSLVWDFEDKIIEPLMKRDEALRSIAAHRGVSPSEIEKALTRFGIGVKKVRKAAR